MGLGLASFAGPASGDGLDEWQSRKPPRLRIAASPYPNFLLHILPEEEGFGGHLYRVKIDTLGWGPSSETGRGHLYTRRGGFLDLAHVRRTIDFAGYAHHRVREALRSGATHFSFESIDRTTYHCHLAYPPFWKGLATGERERLVEEIALLAAAEAAFDFNNWREFLTWYGFHNVPGMPEKGSAFSYEDVPSHAVGIAVAARALRAPGVPFDKAVTRELERELAELEVVPQATYRRAMDLVADRWWAKKTCLKRHLDTGRDDGFVDPWLVRGLEPGRGPQAKRYPAPSRGYRDVLGHDCRGMVVFECEPKLRREDVLRQVLPTGETRVRPARDYPDLLRRIEEEVRREFGPNATRPYP